MGDHGHRDIQGWGLYSIFKEAGRLLYKHFRIFRPFILAFILPLAVMVFLEVIGITWFLTWLHDQVQPHHFGGRTIFGHYHRHSRFHAFRAAFVKAPNPPIPPFISDPLVVFYTLDFLASVITWLLGSLASAAIAKAIQHIYSSNSATTSPNEDENSSQTQTLIQSIFASLPQSFYRIFIISLCFFVVDVSAYFLIAVPLSLLSHHVAPPFTLLAALLWNLIFLAIDFWFQVSIQVVVLESRYDGWAALGRSARLVKAKAATALGLTVVYFVYFLGFGFAVVQTTQTIPAHSVVLYVVAAALALAYLVPAAFGAVVVTVFYFVSERKWSSSGGGEEGRQARGDEYQALGVSVEN